MWVAMESLLLVLHPDRAKGERMLEKVNIKTKMKSVVPLVVTLSLEFSRLPEMLSPLKTTLFPVPALTLRRQIGESTPTAIQDTKT